MGRVLFWLLLGVVVYAVLRSLGRAGRGAGSGVGSGAAPGRAPAPSEDMVRCRVCGLNVPKSDALAAGPDWYCSDEHRRIGAPR